MNPLLLLPVLIPLASARISLPAPARLTAATPATISWTVSPPHTPLAAPALALCWGSNKTPNCNLPLHAPAPAATAAAITIPPDAAGRSEDPVFFLRLTDGGDTTVYSERFVVDGLSGEFTAAERGLLSPGEPAPEQDAAEEEQDAEGVDGGKVPPYSQQTGPTRYAPMQTQPGTVITATAARRQYPTSSFTVFTAPAGPPSAETTVTLPWDYEVATKVNTARAAVRGDEGGRWRD